MIEDKELRDLFKIESEEHLQRLEAGLLTLEKGPANSAVLDDVFREAHSLKGAARMVGLTDIEMVSHRLENILGNAKKGETTLTPDSIERMYRGLDAVRKLAHEAVTGEPSGIITSDVMDHIAEFGVRNVEVKSKVEKEFKIQDLKTKQHTPEEMPLAEDSALRTPQSEIQIPKSKIEQPVPEEPPKDKDSTPDVPLPEFKIDTVRVGTKA